MDYPVYLGENKFGTAKVSREGLYYRIRCICDRTDSTPLRIKAKAEHSVDLGLCVPVGDCYGVEVRIPIKRLGSGALHFFVEKKETSEEWISISQDEPFMHIARLKNAYLLTRNGKPGIGFKNADQFPDPPDNDRNP